MRDPEEIRDSFCSQRIHVGDSRNLTSPPTTKPVPRAQSSAPERSGLLVPEAATPNSPSVAARNRRWTSSNSTHLPFLPRVPYAWGHD